MTVTYSTDKAETTLQDAATMLGCDLQGYTVLLAGDVTGLMPKHVKTEIERHMKHAMVDKGLDVSTFIINKDKQRIMDFISKQADVYQVNLLKVAGFHELQNHKIDAVLPIGEVSEKLIKWAKAKGWEVWGDE